MRVTIYQPQYFPRLHYFNRILSSDIYVIFGSAQYTNSLVHITKNGKEKHKSYQSHSPIKNFEGEQLITVPVESRSFNPINETNIDYTQAWVNKNLKTIEMNYGRSKYFNNIYFQLENILSYKYANLAELNITTTLWGLNHILDMNLSVKQLKIDTVNNFLENSKKQRLRKIIQDKDTGAKRSPGEKMGTDWVAKICEVIGANEQYHGETSQAGYMDTSYLSDMGIKSTLQKWTCMEYNQQYQKKVGFLPNLSILDLLFNLDKKEVQHIILS